MSVLLEFVFPPPSSLFLTAMTVISFSALAFLGFLEIRGTHLQYSKFSSFGSQRDFRKQIKLPSRTGMFLFYAPAFLAALSSFLLFPNLGFRFMCLKSALTLHFLKRVFEVLFMHKYSGETALDTTLLVAVAYFMLTINMAYAQHLTQGNHEPPFDLKYAGIILFVLGIGGNFYHHYLLSKMREKGDKGYKIPKGGLFNLVVCPHYLFEIIEFLGISFISQTVFTFFSVMGSAFYLMGRSYVTRKWYISKFENFPKDVKALIPYVF